MADENDEQQPEPPVINREIGQNPLVPSAPADAEEAAPLSSFIPPDQPAPRVIVLPRPRRQGPLYPRDRINPSWHPRDRAPKYGRAVDQFDEAAMYREQHPVERDPETGALRPMRADQYRPGKNVISYDQQGRPKPFDIEDMYREEQGQRTKLNREAAQTLKEAHVQLERDPDTGVVSPVRDDSGNIQYRPGKGAVSYDQQGRAIQTQYDTSGPKQVELDKDSEIGPIEGRPPNELYKQNKYSPFEYVGTIDEGLKHSDKNIQQAAQTAKLKLEHRLHAAVANDLGQTVSEQSLVVQGKISDFKSKGKLLGQLSQQLDNFDAEHPGITETEGGFLGMGARPSQTATTLQAQKADLQKQIEDLQGQGYSTDPKAVTEFTKTDRESLAATRAVHGEWSSGTPKEPGDFDRLIDRRKAILAEQGVDVGEDPILQSLEKRRAELGVGAPTPKDHAAEDELRKDATFGPLLQERDQLHSAHEAASNELQGIQDEYDKVIGPVRERLRVGQAQIAPIQAEVEAYSHKLDQVLGMPTPAAGDEQALAAREAEWSTRISQLTDPRQKARVQTVLNALEPAKQQLRMAQAQLQPVQDTHDALVEENQRMIADRHAQFENELGPQREDLQARMGAAHQQRTVTEAVRKSDVLANVLGPLMVNPNDPGFTPSLVQSIQENLDRRKQEAIKSWDFEPNDFERELFGAPFRMVGEGLKGFAHLSEGLLKLFPQEKNVSDHEQHAVLTRWVADQLLKVPGVLSTPQSEKSLAGKAGGFIGGVAGAVGAGLIDPAILVPQFFGQGVNGQMEAAKQAGADDATALKAGVLGGTINALLAIPFEGFGKALTETFGSAKQSAIQKALKESYERGGAEAVANDLTILRNSMIKTAGRSAFQKTAVDALQPIIEEITKTPLQRAGQVGIEVLKDSALFAGVQAAQNAVTKTYNPDTGLFENVPTAAFEGGVLGAFFGGLRQVGRAQKAGAAREEIATGLAKQARAGEVQPMGVERALPETGVTEGPTETHEQASRNAGVSPVEGVDEAGQGPGPIEQAHGEINNLVVPDVSPAVNTATQHALRGLIKIANGESMEALTTAEKAAVNAKTTDGLPRVVMVKRADGKQQPVITDATLERIRQIAPVTAQVMPQSEGEQRQRILNPVEEITPESGSVEKGEIQPNKKTPEISQPSFEVAIERPSGEVETRTVQAASAEAAKGQVAGSISPGQGMVRDVSEVPQAMSGFVPLDEGQKMDTATALSDEMVGQVREQAGRELQPEEEQAVRGIAERVTPAIEKFRGAFSSIQATLEPRGSMGAFTTIPEGKLVLSLPDIVRHAQEWGEPEGPDLVVEQEAIHAVADQLHQQGKIDPEGIARDMPAELREHVAGVYNPDVPMEERNDLEDGHEFLRLLVQHQLRVDEGKVVDADGKVITENLSPGFIARIRQALVRLFEVFRDMAKRLGEMGAKPEYVEQVQKARDLIVTRLREVDAGSRGAYETTNGGKTAQVKGKGGKAPAERSVEGELRVEPKPTAGQGQVAGAGVGGAVGQPHGVMSAATKTLTGQAGSGAGAELTSKEIAQAAIAIGAPRDKITKPWWDKVGNKHVLSQGGRSVNVAYVAQEASKGRTSHDALGNASSGYDLSLQPRDRSLAQYRKQSQNIAQNLDFAQAAFFPETTTPATTGDIGAPVMTPTGDTLIGNGREIGIKAAYAANSPQARAYKRDFVHNAARFGIDPAAVMKMRQPVLKRVILDDLPKDELIRLSQESNEGVAMGVNATEIANRDATRLTPEILSEFDPNYALDAAKNRGFLRSYLQNVVSGAGANEANINWPDLARRVRAAVFTYAYGADEAGRAALERLQGEDSSRKITDGLLTVAPIVARMKADIASGDLFPLDISPEIARAVQDISEALRDRPKGQSASVALDGLVAQGELIPAGDAPALQQSVRDFVIANRGNRAAIEEALSNYVESVYEIGNPKQPNLFGEQAGEESDRTQLWNLATKPEAIAPKTEQRELAAQALRSRMSEDRGQLTPLDHVIHRKLRAGKSVETVAKEHGMKVEHVERTYDRVNRSQEIRTLLSQQTFRSETDAFAAAEKAKPSFDQTLEDVAKATGARAMTTPIKSRERAAAKVAADYRGDWSKIKDLVRGTIVVRDLDQAKAVVGALAQRFGVEPKRDFNQPLQSGYRDALFNPIINGYVAEIQVHIEPIIHAKSTSHTFYKRHQEIQRAAQVENRALNSQELRTIERLNMAQQRIYAAAFGNISGEISSTASEGLQGKAPTDLISSGVIGRGESPSKAQAVPSLSTTIPKPAGASMKDLASGKAAIASSSVIPPSLTPTGGVRHQEVLLAQKLKDTGTLDLFGDYVGALPAAAKASKPALKREVEKDVPSLAESGAALSNLFELAQPGKTYEVSNPVQFPKVLSATRYSDSTVAKVAHNYVTHQTEYGYRVELEDGRQWIGSAKNRDAAITKAQYEFRKTLTEAPAAGIPQANEDAVRKTARANRKAKVGTETATGVDDLFSLLAEQHGSERDTGLAGGVVQDAIGAPGRTDVAGAGDLPGHETDAGRPGGSVTAGDTDGGRGLAEPTDTGGNAAPSETGGKRTLPKLVSRPADPNARNYVIPRDTKEIAPRGAMAKLRANQDAIKLLKQIETEQRLATPEEKSQLVKYSGWGALSQAFDDAKADRIAAGEISELNTELQRYRGYQERNRESSYYSGEIGRLEKDIRSLESWQSKWGDIHSELKSMLTPDEYKRAMRSTINAHYTSPEMIKSMWDIAAHLGFKGGNVLEPGAGIGHFFGLMPEELLSRSSLHAVELDDISGRLTKMLYPEADVQITGFQNADIADGSVDLSISNVPFANVPVTDKAMELSGGPTDNLHDYFLANMIKKLRPGGLNIAITSAFTMDKGASENRKWMADRADLVAAFRLPNNAFKANAGTDVVTDILVFRKKDGQIFPHAKDWTMLDNATTQKGDPIRVNQYFAQHPQDILGFLADDGEMFAHGAGEKEMTVHADPNRPPAVALEQAIDNLPKDIAGDGNAAEVRSNDPTISKMGNIVEKDGKYFFHGQAEPDEALNDPKNAKRVRKFIETRDVLNEQYRLELDPEATDEDVEANRRMLNARYDSFTADFSNFHTPKNKGLFIDDPDWFRLAGAETPIQVSGGVKEMLSILDGKKSRQFTKADVFKKRVLTPIIEPTKADSLEDAFGMSLGWRGRVDLGYISDLTGQSREQVEQGLVASGIVVRDPENGQLQSREQYLAGNVRKKLDIAKAAGPDYERNAQMLEAVQPEDVPIDEIRFKIGATWVPVDAYQQFLSTIGIELPIEYHTALAGGRDFYTVGLRDYRATGVAHKDFRTDQVSVPELMDSMLNMKRIEVLHTDKDRKGDTDEGATMAARDAGKRLSDAFVAYAKGNAELGPRLAQIYNREANGFAQRTYDGQFLTLPWKNKDFDLFPDKKNVIWRAIQDRYALIAWGVGGGKTVIAAGIALELRRLKLALKPMVVVHNSTLEQYADEIAVIAPSARVLIGRKDELSGAKRKEFLMRIAAGDWDAVVIAHSTFGLIEDDPVFQTKHMESLVDEAMQSLTDRGYNSVSDAKKSREPSVKQLVKMIEQLETKIQALSERKTDTGLLNFQQLGVDALIVDEVHKFKKMPFSTKLDVKGIDSGMSQRGYAMLLRARSIQERNGGKNVFSMTGTPVTNTLGEIWNQVRLVAPHLLKEYGVETFDQFVSKFAEVETISEAGPSGERKMVERLSKIVNLPEWSTFFRQAADVKLGDDMVVKNRPGIKGGGGQLIALERTPGTAAWVNYIRNVLEGFKELKYDDFKDNKSLFAVPVQAYIASRAAAIDIRLIEPRAKDESGSKANRAVRGIIKLYRETTPYNGTQVIFSDSFNQVKTSLFDAVVPRSNLNLELDPSKPPGTTFNLYEDIKAKLIALGVPAEEIAIVADKEFDNAKRKKSLFEDVNKGKVRIVMGSTEKLGTGVNMQERMLAAWNLDVPWTAAGLEQRDGRVYRQGNVHAEMGVPVELTRLGMKDTLDESLWKIIERKLRIQKQALSGKIVGRELEEMSDVLSLAEQASILSGPYGAESFELDSRIRELEGSRAGHDRQVANRDSEIRSSKEWLRQQEAEEARSEPAMQLMAKLGERVSKDGAQITVDGDSFETKTAMVERVNALLDAEKNKPTNEKSKAIFSVAVNGVPVRLDVTPTEYDEWDVAGVESKRVTKPSAQFDLMATDSNSPKFGRVTSAATLLARLEELSGTVDGIREGRKNNTARLRQLAEMQQLGKWPFKEEYQRALARQKELLKLMRGEELKKTGEGEETPNAQRPTPNAQPAELRAQATADAAKTPAERFKDAWPLAESIARSYSNIPGVTLKDVEQHARIALVRAAREFDPARGAAMDTFARKVVGNELRSLYGRQMRTAGRESTVLDVPVSAEGSAAVSQKENIVGPSDVRADVARTEATQMLSTAIDELPDKMRDVMNGILSGKETLGEIGERLGGLPKQAVGRLASAAMRRLKGKLGEKGVSGVTDLLSQETTTDNTDTEKKTLSDFLAKHDASKGTVPAKKIAEPTRRNVKLAEKLGNQSTRDSSVVPNFRPVEQEIAIGRAYGYSDNDIAAYLQRNYVDRIPERVAQTSVGVRPPQELIDKYPELKHAIKVSEKYGHLVKLSEQLELLSQVVEDEVKLSESADPVASFMELMRDDPVEKLRGIKGIGRPDLALGAEPAMRPVHEFHTATATPQKLDDWDKQGEAILRSRGDKLPADVTKRWLDGSVLEPAEVRATQQYLIEKQGQPKTPEEQRGYDALAYAYTKIGEATARALSARRDPFKTPEERNREFIGKALVHLSATEDRELDAIADHKEKVARLEQIVQGRRTQINAALEHVAGKGVTIDDILSGGTELRLKGAKMIENQMAGYGESEKKVIKLAQTGARSAAEIAKATGLSVKQVNDINDQFVSDLETKLMAKTRAGATLENLDAQQIALLAQETERRPGASATVSEDVARAEARKMIKAMGFVASKDLGTMKVVRRKRSKLFIPPSPRPAADTAAPTPGELPTGQETQAPMMFGGERSPVAPREGELPRPAGQQAPYTGRVLGQIGLPLYQEMMIRKGADMSEPTDVARLGNVIHAATSGNAFDMVYEAWINNILSGPATHMANITGNAVSTAWDFSLQRGLESLVNLAYRDADSAQLGEFKHIVNGIVPGLRRGLSIAVKAWGAEADFFRNDVLNEQVEMFQDFEKGSGGALGPAIPGRTGRVIRMPGRALMFMDAAFKGLIGQMEAGAVAYRIAKREGLTGDAMATRMNELVATPNSEAWQRAVDKAVNLTFQDQMRTKEEGGNPFENAVARFNQMRTGSHLLGFFFPFIRTPYNIFKMGLRKTPLGSANMAWRFSKAGFYRFKDGKPMFESYDKGEQVRHLAEQLIAWATFAALWAATTGDDDDDKKALLFTGSTPVTEVRRSERELRTRLHGGQYQIRVGGRNGVYINYGRYEPFATVIGTVVDAITNLKKIKRGQTLGESLDAMYGYFLAQAKSKTFLQGFAEIADSLESGGGVRGGITEAGKKMLLSALVPNLVRQPLRNLDEWVRDTKGAAPIYQMLPAGSLAERKADLWGRDVQKSGNIFSRLFLATGTKVEPDAQKVDLLLQNWVHQNPGGARELSVPSSAINRTYKDAIGKEAQMTPEQFHRFTVDSGKLALTRLRGKFTQRQIDHPKAEDVKMIRGALEDARREVKERMFPAGPRGFGHPRQAINLREVMWAA